jgi:subtilisin family serine protease
LQADSTTFDRFAAPVRTDLESILRHYDIQDHEALRKLLGTELSFQLLSGREDAAALQTIQSLRALEDKPDAKLLFGLEDEALIKARQETSRTSGEAFTAAYGRAYGAAIHALPWSIVANRVREEKMHYEIFTAALIRGVVQAKIEPAVAQSHSISNELVWDLVSDRVESQLFIPLKNQTLAALSTFITAHNVQKPDIWAARDVTLDASQKLTPVRVGIWDSGVDILLFPSQTYTDPVPGKYEPHGLAFDLLGVPAHGNLFPLTPEQQQQYLNMIDLLKGFADLQLSIDSPEATALRQTFTSLPASEVPEFIEDISLYGNYVHGTHVAGIVVRGNPGARIVVARITYDWKNVPTPPTEEIENRFAADVMETVAYFKKHDVRVVNMSWGESPVDFENALEKNGIGKDATERQALARKYFNIDREGLYAALKSAPKILFICAAGNSDSNNGFNEFIPSSLELPNLLTVGAVDSAGEETSFTSYGKNVVVDANGYAVESYYPGGRRVRMSGTSMATPNVVNLAAKLFAVDPSLTPAKVIDLIRRGATTSADERLHLIDSKRSVELLRSKQSLAP